MRVLFKNLIENGSIIGTNESSNYPALNLSHPFLRKRFQTITASSLITVLFSSDQIMNCFFYGYHTLTGLTIVLKNSVDAVLDTIVVSDIQDIGVEYFAEQTTVRKIELSASGPDPFYIGGIAAGSYYQMPDPLAVYTDAPVDNSIQSSSSYGQTLQNYVDPLNAFEFGFRDNEGTIKKEVKSKYKSVGIGKTIYFDFYEENREKEEPMYGKIVSSPSFSYNPRRYDFTLQVQEAR